MGTFVSDEPPLCNLGHGMAAFACYISNRMQAIATQHSVTHPIYTRLTVSRSIMMNDTVKGDIDDNASSDDEDIPTLCDLDDEQLPPVPVTILTGFLGSGKTSLVKHILSSKQHQKRIAVIENEFGGGESNLKERLGLEVNDASTLSVETMIAKDGTDGSSLTDFIELPNGCVCCTVKDSLVETLEALLTKRTDLDYIIIECSGLADPGPVASIFWLDDALDSRIRLDGVVTLIDAKNILHQLESTSSASSFHGESNDGGDEAARQIAYADRIIINKIDLLKQNSTNNSNHSLSKLQSVLDRIKEINPTAKMRQTTFSVIDIDWIIDANCFDAERVKEVEDAFQQSVQDKKMTISCFNPRCTVDHNAFQFCGLCDIGSPSSLIPLHNHTNAVGTTALFHIGSIDIHKLNLWLASILWPNQDEADKVLRARLEESLRTEPKHPMSNVPTEVDGSMIYRVKGVVSVKHSIDSTGKIASPPNDFLDDTQLSSFVNESDRLDNRRYIVQAVHDLWDITASKNLLWDTSDTRCCKIIVIGKRLDEKALREGFIGCFS